jgi:hypothetical protein
VTYPSTCSWRSDGFLAVRRDAQRAACSDLNPNGYVLRVSLNLNFLSEFAIPNLRYSCSFESTGLAPKGQVSKMESSFERSSSLEEADTLFGEATPAIVDGK